MPTPASTDGRYTLIYGGDDRVHALSTLGPSVRTYAGSRQGGSNSRKKAEQAIRGGRVGLVMILVRWASHPDVGALKEVCRTFGVEVRLCSAGFASVRAELEQLGAARKAA